MSITSHILEEHNVEQKKNNNKTKPNETFIPAWGEKIFYKHFIVKMTHQQSIVCARVFV